MEKELTEKGRCPIENLQERLKEIAQRIKLMESHLPKRIDATSTAKIPFKAIQYREGLIWRFTELSRCALTCYRDASLASALILTRASLETTAASWYLNKKVASVVQSGNVGDIDEFMMRLNFGNKTFHDSPDPINVLTFIKEIEKDFEGFSRRYDILSEYSHPNWAGTLLLFSKINKKKFWTDFGKNVRGTNNEKEIGTSTLITILEIFEHSYNQISDMMPEFRKICEHDLEKK